MPLVRPPAPEPIITTPVVEPNTLGSIIVDGAMIDEALTSDAGNVLTLDRKGVVKRYICKLPTIQDKPIKFLAKAFPIGALYPGRDPNYNGLIVYGYEEGERIGVQEWHASVIYSTLDQLATLNWVTEGEFSEEQETITRDEAEIYTLDSVGNQQVQIGRLLGQPVYNPDDTGTYTASSSSGNMIPVEQTGAFQTIGEDRYRSTFRFSMVRTLFFLTWQNIRAVGLKLCTANAARFLTFEPGELLFLNFAWREVYGIYPTTQSSSNKNFEVRLQFAANSKRWTPIYRVDHYEDESGFRSPVFGTGINSGQNVVRTFDIYKSSNFVDIFNTLNTGAPVAL